MAANEFVTSSAPIFTDEDRATIVNAYNHLNSIKAGALLSVKDLEVFRQALIACCRHKHNFWKKVSSTVSENAECTGPTWS